ncbi:MAG: hypothetical protein MJ208_00990 [Bacilli bacterium]|nr:hypothetical protein [Bacilli bacterium]
MKHLKLILKTLISNNACVEAARTRELKYNIIAIVFALFALFFASMPTCVTGFQQQGGAWLRGYTYSFDTGMMDFGNSAEEKDVTFSLTENSENHRHCLTASDNWNTVMPAHYDGHDNLHFFRSMNKDGTTRILEIFVCNEDSEEGFAKYVADIVNNLDPTEGHDHDIKNSANWLETTKDKDGNDILKPRSTSFLVFGRYNVQGVIFQPDNTNVGSSSYGDYDHVDLTDNLIPTLYTKNNNTKTLEQCQSFFDKVFINPRFRNTWRSTGIILGVDAGIVILMGFLVWLLTRGKNNPFRIYTIWDSQKIAYYASFTPGLIALFGFLMQNMAMMLFILGVGVRVMWLSMRTLRYQAPASN